MKKFTALIVMLCFILTILPFPQMAQAASKQVPKDITISIDDEGEVVISIPEEAQNKEARDWLQNVKQVVVDSKEYYKAENGEHHYYSFVIDEDNYSIELTKKIVKKKQNKFKILASGYKTYEKSIKNTDVSVLAEQFELRGIEEKTLGDEKVTKQALVIKVDYGVDDSIFDAAFRMELDRISIDGKMYQKHASDKMNFLTPNTRTLQIYETYEEGRDAIERFRKNDKHEVVVYFTDGSKLTYRDEGYEASEDGDEEDEEEDDESGENGKESNANAGKMAEGLELASFTSATPGFGWKGVKLDSDVDRDKWYAHYYLKMRYVVIDDKEVFDLRTSQGRADVKLDQDHLAIGTYIPFYEAGESHKICIYFDDKSFVEKATPGYEAPENPVDPFAKEPEKSGQQSSEYVLTDLRFKEDYSVETLYFDFENIAKIVSNLAGVMPKTTVIINGQEFSGDNVKVSKWMERVSIDLPEAIAALKKDTKVTVAFKWPDGTQSTFKKTFDSWNTLQTQHPLEEISIQQEKDDNKLLIKVGDYKADTIKSAIAKDGIVVNGKSFGVDKFVFGAATIDSTDKEVWQALTREKNATIRIKWTDGSCSELTKKLDFKEAESTKKSLTDDATNIRVIFDAYAFGKTPQFKVEALNKEALAGKSSRIENIYKAHKTINGYTFNVTEATDKGTAMAALMRSVFFKKANVDDEDDEAASAMNVPVEFEIPLGAHDAESVKVYVYDEVDGYRATSAFEVKDSHVIIKEKAFKGEGTYIVASGVKENTGEEPVAPAGPLADTYKITGIKASDYGTTVKIFVENYDVLMSKHKKELLKAFQEATYRINGVETKGLNSEVVFTSYDSINIDSEAMREAFKKNPKGAVSVVFSDKSKWTNGVAEEVTPEDEPGEATPGENEYGLKDELPAGDYTISYKAINKKTKQESVIQKFFAPTAHLHVKDGVYQITFLNTSRSEGILDFAVQSKGQYERGVKADYQEDAIKKTFTLNVSELEKVHTGAILLSFMNGRESDINDYDKYTLFDIQFVGPIKKGWDGFAGKVDKEKEKQENDKLLTLKLISAGVKDKDGDNELSPKELSEAKGKLDLSGEKLGRTSDVSMLKDLGAGVTDLYISANGIKELPDGFFDKMVNLETIYVGGNNLKRMPANAFKNNTKLREVSMSSNPFESLDENIFSSLAKLRVLDLSNTNLQEMADGLLKNNSKLQELYLYENSLKTLPDSALKGKTVLRRIDLNSNELENIPQTISECEKLEYFWAYNNKLTAIPESFSKLINLYSLDLSNNHISQVPESFWKRISLNARKKNTIESKLILSNNLIKDIPFEKMAKNGSNHFHNINVNLNLLKGDLTDQDIKMLKDAGVHFTDMVRNAYQPQKTIIDAKAEAKGGKIALTQDLDMVEAAIWIRTDGLYNIPLFKDRAAFVDYLDNNLKKAFNIRTVDRGRGAAEVFYQQEYEWKIHTNIIKKGADGKVSKIYDAYSINNLQDKNIEVNPIDGKTFEFNDPTMKKGDQYTLTKVIYTKKGAMPYQNAVSYSVDCTATSHASAEPVDNNVEQLPFEVLHATKESKSHAADALNPIAEVKVVGDKYEVTLTAKAMTFKGTRGHVERFFVYNDLDAMKKADSKKRRDVKVVSTYEDKGKRYPEKVTFTLDSKPTVIGMGAQVDVMNHAETEFRLVFGKGDPTPTPDQPSVEENAWEVPVTVLQAAKDVASAANGAFGEKALVAKTKDGYRYTFKTPKFTGMTGGETWLTQLHVYSDADAQAIKDETAFKVVSEDKGRWTSIAFDLEEKANVVPVTLQAQGMPFAAEARIVLDWTKAKAVTVAPQPGDEEDTPSTDSAEAKALKALIAEATDALDNGKVYTDTSKKAVNQAIEAAKKALKANDKAACKKAASDLSKALAKLKEAEEVENNAAVKALDQAISNAQAKLRDGKTYTDATKAALKDALSKAKAARQSGKDSEVKAATKALNKAIEELKVAGKDNAALVKKINTFIKKAEAALESDKDYTKSSRRALRAAIVRAQDAIEDEDATAMEKAYAEMQETYRGLTPEAVEEENETDSEDENNIEEKISKKAVAYKVDVSIKQATKDKPSMANDSIRHTAKVVEKNGKATYTVFFKPMKKGDMEGKIEALTINGKKAKAIDGSGAYDKGFVFTRNKLREKAIPVTFEIDAMGGMEQDARLVFDWSSKERIDEKEDLAEDEEDKQEVKKDKKKKAKDALKKAYIQGYEDNSFKPDNHVTRAEAATILANFIDESTKKSKSMLNDVHKDAWYYDSVQRLVDSKMLSGYPDGTFRPNAELTRAELVVLMARLKQLDGSSKSFADVKGSHWAADAISACAEAGYVSGYPNGTFAPDQQITRAEVVVVVNRVFKIPTKDSSDNTFKDVAVSHWAYKDIQKAANN